MDNKPNIKLYAVTLDCKDPLELAKFYAALLSWDVVPVQGDEYVVIAPPGAHQGAYPGITFQKNPDYVPPVWPEEAGKQQQMAHMDFAVDDLEQAVAHAVQCGAAVANRQFTGDWTVMLDPEGHPFCLCRAEQLFKSAHFALL